MLASLKMFRPDKYIEKLPVDIFTVRTVNIKQRRKMHNIEYAQVVMYEPYLVIHFLISETKHKHFLSTHNSLNTNKRILSNNSE